jgi:hypothetical protein
LALRSSSNLSWVLDVLEKSSAGFTEVADLTLATAMRCLAACSGAGSAGERKCHARGRRKLRMPSRPRVDPNPECFTPAVALIITVSGNLKAKKKKIYGRNIHQLNRGRRGGTCPG